MSRGTFLTILITAIIFLEATNLSSSEGLPDVLAARFGSMYSTDQPKIDSSQSSRPAFETLRGNGTGTGYILGHGSVIPNSESVTVGGSKKMRAKDYHMDYAGGSIVFSEPVKQGEPVSVSYRYAENGKSERTLVGLAGLPLVSSQNLALNLTYAYRTGNLDSGQALPNLATYGINVINKFGQNSSLKSMFYLSSPQHSSQIRNNLSPQNGSQNDQQKVKSDRLIVEDGEFGIGSLKLKMNYQDVGADFAGFTSLQDASPDLAGLFNQLSKEKGLKRLGMQADFGIGRGMSLSAATSKIHDKTGDIINQSFGFTSSRFKASYSTSEVGNGFTRFADIKEANRDQLAKEKGMKRTSFGLDFASSGSVENPQWNKLGFNTISDVSGQINSRFASVNLGKIGLNYFNRSVDKGFARLGSLSRDDATMMALQIRQQFDPNATEAQVTDDDRNQILSEAGIDRTSTGINYAGKSIKTNMQMLSISDGSGKIDRQAINISGKNFSLGLVKQNIDETFGKLGVMAPVEKSHFGNERGMDRLNLTGTAKIGIGDIALGFSRVTDSKGATVLKQSIGLANNRFNFKASVMDIDENFDRAGDLADPERGLMQQERGFRRLDLNLSGKLTSQLDFNSFYYSSKNSSANLAREQFLNQFNYSTNFGAKISLFRDQFTSTDANGQQTGYVHQWIKVDHTLRAFGGLALTGLHDTNQVINQDGKEITATVDQMHLETNKNKRTWGVIDRKMVDFGDGRIENTQSYNITSKLSNRLNFNGMLVTIDRGKDGSESLKQYNLQWNISSKMKFTADVMDKNGNNNDVTARHSYRFEGLIVEKFGMFRNVKFTAIRMSEDSQGQLGKEINAVKLETSVMNGNLITEFASTKDSSGNHPLSRGISFISDRNDKKKMHFGIAYKQRDLGPGNPIAIRAYDFNYRLTNNTVFTYNYFTYREKPDNTVDPVGGKTMRLSTVIRGMNVLASFREESNFLTKWDHDIYELGISGKLPWGAQIELAYGLDKVTMPGSKTKGHNYRAKYIHQLNSDHFLMISGELKTLDSPTGDNKEAEARIDFNKKFN